MSAGPSNAGVGSGAKAAGGSSVTTLNSATANPLCEVFQFHDTIRQVGTSRQYAS